MPKVFGVVCFAVLAFVAPILAFVSALLIRRRLQRERQKSVIYRVQGLDPPVGTRDPALLWPSVLAKPPEAATVSTVMPLSPARSGSPLDDDDSPISKRPNSLAASNSSSQSAHRSTVSNESAAPRILARGSFQGIQRATAAVVASSAQQHRAAGYAHHVDKTSSSDSNGDCRVDLTDVRCTRDQHSMPGNATASAGSVIYNMYNMQRESGVSSVQHPAVLHLQGATGLKGHWNDPPQASMARKVSDQDVSKTHSVHVVTALPVDAALHVEESSRLQPLCA